MAFGEVWVNSNVTWNFADDIDAARAVPWLAALGPHGQLSWFVTWRSTAVARLILGRARLPGIPRARLPRLFRFHGYFSFAIGGPLSYTEGQSA
jgi:hypothetical protein